MGKLFWVVVRRMMAWGFGAGACLGFLYTGIAFSLSGANTGVSAVLAFIGLVVGGLFGLVLGVSNGIVVATAAQYAQRRADPPSRYLRTVVLSTLLLTAVGAILGFSGFWGFDPASTTWLVYALVPSLIAAAVAGLASARTLLWVEALEKELAETDASD